MSRRMLVAALLATVLLTGCAANPPTLDEQPLDDTLAPAGVSLPESDLPLPLPEGELSRTEAVHQALWRNPRMQRAYAALQLDAADVVEASQFSNPRLSLGLLRPEGGGGNKASLGLSWGIAGLLMRRSRLDIAEAHWQARRLQLAESLLALASDTERAWFAVVEAEQAAWVNELEHRTADLAYRLGQRFHEAGNMNDLDLARLRVNAAEASVAQEDAERQVRLSRTRLAALMGLPEHAAEWDLPTQLPLPADALDQDLLISEALDNRLDLRSLDMALEGLTEGVALARRFRWLGDIEPGIAFEREKDGTRLYGASLALGLPLFHQNQAAQSRADAQLVDGEARRESLRQGIIRDVRQLALEREAHASRFAQFRNELLPAHEQVIRFTQERVNFMFDDVFDLLASKQDELAAWGRAVDELGAYWQTQARLAHAVGTDLPGVDDDAVFDTSGLEYPPGAHAEMHGDHGHGGEDHEDHPDDHDHDHDHDHDGHGGHH